MKKLKILTVGTSGMEDKEDVNRVVLVNTISFAVGIAIIFMGTAISYYLKWKPAVVIPLSVEFIINGFVIVLNYYRWHRTAAGFLYFLQCVAITYFGFSLIRLFHLEFVIILLIAIIYLIFKEPVLRRIALGAAFLVLLLLEGYYYRVDAHPAIVENYDLIFFIRSLLVITIMSITVLISRPYVVSNDLGPYLKKANDLIKIFVAQVTHELRTPLNNIHQVTQLLQKEVRSDENLQKIKSLVDIGYAETCHARNLVNNVLDMAEIEAGRFHTSVNEAFKIIPFFEKILDIHKIMARAEGVRIKLEVDPEMPEVIFGDPLNVNQVVTNLLGNALKYGYKGKEITVRVARTPGWWELSVSNFGPSISSEKMNVIFDPFVRGKTGHVQGSGLGLYIVKSKVFSMGGSIRVDSQENDRTVFRIAFPLREGKLRDLPDAVGLDADMYDLNKIHVLVAEDDKIASFLLSRYLHNMGCSYTLVSNGNELLEMLEDKCPDDCPDIILLDSHMPVRNGEDTIKELRKNPLLKHIPIIITTGDLFSDTVDKMLAGGASTYLKKPIDYLALQKTIGLFLKKLPAN